MELADITFDSPRLSSETRESLATMGYQLPTACQKETLPWAFAGRDLVVQSRTGTGKTAAFAIPIVERIDLNGAIQALVLTPTRELALQVTAELGAIGRGRGVRVETVYAGVAKPVVSFICLILVLSIGRDGIDRRDTVLLLIAFLCIVPVDILMSLVVFSPEMSVASPAFMTGGVLRESIRVIRGCCVYCQEYDLGQITHNALDIQKSKLKGEYYRMLEHDDYKWLRRVNRTKSRADVNMRHLESLCVLYYPNGKGWFDVHPVVRELLEEWEREALPADVQVTG